MSSLLETSYSENIWQSLITSCDYCNEIKAWHLELCKTTHGWCLELTCTLLKCEYLILTYFIVIEMGAGIVVQWVSHRLLCWCTILYGDARILAALLLIQHPADAPREPMENAPSAWPPSILAGNLNPGFSLVRSWL